MFKLNSGSLPKGLTKALIKEQRTQHEYHTRHRNLPYASNLSLKQIGPVLCHGLPENMKLAKSLKSFTSKIKTNDIRV